MKRVLVISGIIIFLLALGTFVVLYNASYDKGYRAGTIVKLSRKGTIFKTWEGQLHIGGMVGNNEGDIASNLWNFSVEKGDTATLAQLEKAQLYGYRVRAHYSKKYMGFFWRGDTKYFVDGLEKVGKFKQE